MSNQMTNRRLIKLLREVKTRLSHTKECRDRMSRCGDDCDCGVIPWPHNPEWQAGTLTGRIDAAIKALGGR